jgi:hypothetical protein
MARAQAQYLRIYDLAGTTYERWQNYYSGKTVTSQGQSWDHEPFLADGLVTGTRGDEAEITVSVAATIRVVRAFEASLNNGRLVDVATYAFNPALGNDEPQPLFFFGDVKRQLLISQFTGQVVSASGGISNLSISLGSALSPVGAQVPPRKFTTAIMGKGAKI